MIFQNPAKALVNFLHIVFICSLDMYSAALIALHSAIVCGTDLALAHILPFIPMATSNCRVLPSVFNKIHSELKTLKANK